MCKLLLWTIQITLDVNSKKLVFIFKSLSSGSIRTAAVSTSVEYLLTIGCTGRIHMCYTCTKYITNTKYLVYDFNVIFSNIFKTPCRAHTPWTRWTRMVFSWRCHLGMILRENIENKIYTHWLFLFWVISQKHELQMYKICD